MFGTDILNFTISLETSKCLRLRISNTVHIFGYEQYSTASWIPVRRKQVRAPFDITRYNPIYPCISISRCLRDGLDEERCGEGLILDSPKFADSWGKTRDDRQWGASPMTNSACFQSPESLGGCQNSRKQRDGQVSISTDPTTTWLCSKRFTHSRATGGGGGCEAPDISAYDYIACFAMFDIRRFNNMPLLGVLEARNICMGNFDAGFAVQHKE